MSNEGPAAVTYNRKRLLWACCVAMTATAMTFSIRGDTLSSFGLEFKLTHEQEGLISFMGMFGFPIAILLVGPFCDTIGMGLLLKLASCGHLLGVVLTLLSPKVGFPLLLLANLIFSLANGTIEAVANPLVATMYPEEKPAKLSLLHAFWPMGMIIGGLFSVLVSKAMSIPPDPLPGDATSLSWKIKWAIVIICAVAYLIMVWGQKFPNTERVEHGVSNSEMGKAVLAPGFLLLMFCMILTAITELGPDQWVGSVMTDTVKIQGILGLVYAAGLMFVLRVKAGVFIERLSPIGMLTAAAAISAVGLFALSYSFSAGMAFVALTIYGIGKCFFWPTMLGSANERFPRTGALGLALMGGIGMIAASVAGPTMGKFYDKGEIAYLQTTPLATLVLAPDGTLNHEAVESIRKAAKEGNPMAGEFAKSIAEGQKQGAALSFRVVAVLPVVAFVIFALMWAGFKKKGGYAAVHIADEGA